MAKKKTKEKKSKDKKTLKQQKDVSLLKAFELKEDLRKLRFDHSLGQLTDTSKIRKLKKQIALVLTKESKKINNEKTETKNDA